MRASIEEIQAALLEVGKKLGELNLIRDQNSVAVLRTSNHAVRITWKTSSVINFSDFPDSTIDEYLQLLKGRHYNYLLNDGALIQMSYDIKGKNEIIGSRVVWYPCPVVFKPEELEIVPLDELVLTTPQLNISCRGPLRFDFSPMQTAQDHPQTHMHAGLENFRLPLQRAFEPSRFLRFIMRSGYPDIWRKQIELFTCEDWKSEESLTDDDRCIGYLAWNPLTKIITPKV